MTSTAALTQQQFLAVREVVALATIAGANEDRLDFIELDAEDRQRAENMMAAGFVDVPRVLRKTKGDGDLPRVHSVIEVPVRDQEMVDTYFVEDYHAHGNITGLGCRLIKSDYARDEEYGQWLQLTPAQLEGWRYVYPKDARA